MQVFEDIHSDKNIDYATIHIWPKNWSWYKDSTFKNDFNAVVQKTATYINEHAAIMQKIHKPLVVEEFGLPRDNFSFALLSPTTYRNKYYESVLALLNKSKKENSVLAGINFWSFGGFAKPAKNTTPFWKEGDDLSGDPPMEEQGLNSVFAGDTSTWKIILKYAQLIK
jgi:mannan endo-1,4-beta-mannosidase